MSVTFTIDAFCDICETNWVHGICCRDIIGKNISEARRVAKVHGWKRKNGKDICPDCSKNEEKS